MARVSHPRFIVFAALLCVLTAVLWRPLGGARAISAGFDISALGYIAWMWRVMHRANADDIRARAAENDEGRAALLTIAAVLTGVILVTVGLELKPKGMSGLDIAFPVATLVMAWFFGNFIYTLHYAHVYYDKSDEGEDSGGLDFPHCDEPDYWDFAYFAFNLGMAYQVSDVPATSRVMRRRVMLHCVIAFFFNLGVLALALNIVASAISG